MIRKKLLETLGTQGPWISSLFPLANPRTRVEINVRKVFMAS